VALSRRVNPFVTVWFTLYGVVAVVSDALGMDLSRFPGPVRVAVNLAYLPGRSRPPGPGSHELP
jgi:hypothetical protein